MNKESCVKQNDDETVQDRRGFLQCMAWVGTGAMWTLAGGVLKGMPIEQSARGAIQHGAGMGGLRFVQISDTHIGFDKPANTDVTATLRAAIPWEKKSVVRTFSVAATIVVFGLGVWGCGSSGNTASPGAPSPGTATTIDIVGINGALSFSPNPSTIPAGQMVVWHNIDTNTHRVAMDDRSQNFGNIDPGAFSSPMVLMSPGSYHCTIHPVMVGSIKGE
jgi:plastocyanin